MKQRDKLKFREQGYPAIVYALKYEDIVDGRKYTGFHGEEGSDNFKEFYILWFFDTISAQEYLDEHNKEDWFRNREYKIVPIKTSLKKYKSRYVSLEYAIKQSYN